MVGFCNFFSFCQVKLRIFQKEIVYNNSNSSSIVVFFSSYIEKNGAGSGLLDGEENPVSIFP